MDILVSGASGFVGSALVSSLQAAGHHVKTLVRHKPNHKEQIFWDPVTEDIQKEDFEGFDAVVHLAGKNIASGRWTKKRKREIFLSRARDTWLLSQLLLRLKKPPKVLICASAVGIYGDRGSELLTEESALGEGFLAEVCKEWEKATFPLSARGIRVVNSRFGLVLGASGGMLQKMLPIFKLGLGGKLGSGRQFVSWIALDDLIGAIGFILTHPIVEGPLNLTAPNPVTMEEFVKTVAAQVHRPAFFHLPAPLLKLIFGEMAQELFLASTRAIPEKLLQAGYHFKHPDLYSALKDIL